MTGRIMGLRFVFLNRNWLRSPLIVDLIVAQSEILRLWQTSSECVAIIFMASIVIWVLQSFDTRLMMVSDSSDSMLAGIGRFIAPVFAPLGFGNWISSTALLTGLSAKEAVVSTLAVLTNVPDTAQLSTVLGSLFTPLSAVSFLTFTLLYMPCFAAVAAVKRELGSARYAALAMFAQCCVAWIVAFLVYQIGGLILGVTHGCARRFAFAAACARRMGRLPRDAPAKAEGLLRQLQRLRGLQKTAMTNPGG